MNDALPNPSLSRRIALFLYSSGHIAGCLLALAGFGLLFAGVIDRYWWAIVAGLYAVGLFALPRRNADALLEPGRFSEDSLREALQEVLQRLGPRLPEAARSQLGSIRDTVEGLLPALRKLEGEGAIDLKSRHTLVATVTRYLPQTLAAYLRLPPAFARLHHEADGQTPQALLVQQLGLLDAQLKEIARNAYAREFEKLAVNGRFLQDKFAGSASL